MHSSHTVPLVLKAEKQLWGRRRVLVLGAWSRETGWREKEDVDQLARKIFLAAVCWMPLGQLVGQINGAFNSGTSCRMSACWCSLPGEKCRYNVSGSDSVHNTSAVILLCNNVTFIFGKREINGCSIPLACSRTGTSLPWKLATIHFSEGIAESCGLVWGWTGDTKINICVWVGWRIFLELVNYVEFPAFFPSPPAPQSYRMPGVRQSAFPAQISSLRCTACSHNTEGVRFVFSQIGSIGSYFLLNG